MTHPTYYRLTSTTLDVTTATSLEKKHKLIFTEQTGYPSGKFKLAPDGLPYGQTLRGTFNLDVQNAQAAQNIDNILKKGECDPGATYIKNLNLSKKLLEPPVILKPQQMEAFAAKFAPDPSKKHTVDNPLVSVEARVWGAKLEHDDALKLESYYLDLLRQSSNPALEVAEMQILYTKIQNAMLYARTNKNLYSDFYNTYKKIEQECEDALKILKKYI